MYTFVLKILSFILLKGNNILKKRTKLSMHYNVCCKKEMQNFFFLLHSSIVEVISPLIKVFITSFLRHDVFQVKNSIPSLNKLIFQEKNKIINNNNFHLIFLYFFL
jgi:hypothetical protein